MLKLTVQRFIIALPVLATCGCANMASEIAADMIQARTHLVWAARPVATTFGDEQHQKKIGEMLFVQDFESVSEARLAEKIALKPIKAMFAPEPPVYVFDSSTILGQVVGTTRGDKVFCDLKVTTGGSRACLIDSDANGVFDFVNWGQPVVENLFAEFALTFPDTVISAPYTIKEIKTTPLFSVGVLLTQDSSSRYKLELSTDNNKQHSVAAANRHYDTPFYSADGREPLKSVSLDFQAKDLPKIFELGGAQIEVGSVVSGVVTYKVIKGFDPKGAMPISYQGTLAKQEKP